MAKIKKSIDYSKMPDHIWDKELTEFISNNNKLTMELEILVRAMNSLEVLYNGR